MRFTVDTEGGVWYFDWMRNVGPSIEAYEFVLLDICVDGLYQGYVNEDHLLAVI